MLCVEMKTPWPIFRICPKKSVSGAVLLKSRDARLPAPLAGP